LQGDTLSPLLFNLVFDSLMSTLNRPEVQRRGVLWGDGQTKSLWAQFADDAAIISDSFEEAQLLLNLFHRWTSWADLIIRPDKCHSYAACQRNGYYKQIQPTFHVDENNIPSVELGGSITYLGHQFSFSADAELAKTDLERNTQEALDLCHKLPITPLLKCHALNLQLPAKLSLKLSHYNVSTTWIKNNLNMSVT
jgi:hypothetical protein